MKRKIASLLSLTMILSSFVGVNTFADDLPGNVVNNANGGASVNAVDTAKYRIVLPTTTTLNYIVDPQGLAQLGGDGEQIIGDLDAGKGKVYSDKDVAIANRSSKDVKVTATVAAADQATQNGKTVINVVDDITADSAKDKASVQLYVVTDEAEFSVDSSGDSYNHVKDDGTTESDSNSYSVQTSTSKPTDDKKGFLIKQDTTDNTKHEVVVPVVLKKADYVAKATTSAGGTTSHSYDLDGTSIGGAVSFSIAGICTDNDEWDKDGDDLLAPKISVTYNFKNATEDLGEDSIKVISAGLTTNTDSNVKLQTSPMIVTDAESVSADTSKMTIKLLSGDNTAVKTGANDVTLLSLKVDGSTVANPNAVVGDDGTITITNAAFNDKDGKEAVAKISYDGKVYVAKGTIEVPPTEIDDDDVTATTEKITIAVPSAANVSGLDDITDIAVKYDGSALTVTTDYTLTFEDDVLTVEFASDKDADKSVEVTFEASGVTYKATGTTVSADVAPSVTTASVTLSSADDPVYIHINFGSGDKEATAVASITYKNSSGADVTLNTENYRLQDEDGNRDVPCIRISGGYAGSLYSNSSFSSREYTVTFNDTADTTGKFTLKK